MHSNTGGGWWPPLQPNKTNKKARNSAYGIAALGKLTAKSIRHIRIIRADGFEIKTPLHDINPNPALRKPFRF